MNKLDRRTALRGMMYGGAITVGLPFLECFLNESGTALASGMPLPARFGTWFWGLGTQKQISQPTKFGPDYDLRGQLVPLKAVKQHINVFSNFVTPTDGRPNFVHHTGAGILRCGQAPTDIQSLPSESIDVTISDAIGGASRFNSLEMTATADRSHSYSVRGPNAVNPPEVSPVEFYQRVYGPEFQNPNSPVFKPNPELVLRKSVLSAVLEDSAKLRMHLGSADKARLDEYFTSLRGMEQRLALQLKKPPPAEQCYVPEMPKGVPEEGLDWALVAKRHNAMADILVAALSCNQTRVFNMVYSWSGAGTIKEGLPTTHHITTHEETKNKEGFQEWHEWFLLRAMESWAYFVNKLASVREGDGTLLDNTLVYAHSEHGNAQTHSLEGIPVMTAGRGGGAVKTGIHFDGKGKPATQIGLSLMHAMGLKTAEWGFGSIKTNQTVDGFLV